MKLQLNCVISNWECSGQEDGGFIASDDDLPEEQEGESNDDDREEDNVVHKIGSTKNHPQRALDQQKCFVNGKSVHLLYLREMLEQHDLLASLIQHLNMSVCTGNGNTEVPSITGGKHSIEEDESIDIVVRV